MILSSRNPKIMSVALLVASMVIFGSAGFMYNQQVAIARCEACGMEIVADMREHITIKDGSGNSHYACCQGCMLRLLDPKKGYEELNIDTYCDYYGSSYKIRINAKAYGNVTTVTPNTAVILLGTKIVQSCANNRIAYNQTAAQALLSNGFTSNTMRFQQNPLPSGTPVIAIPAVAAAMALKGISYVPPSPVVPILLAVIGVSIMAGSFVAYKRLRPR